MKFTTQLFVLILALLFFIYLSTQLGIAPSGGLWDWNYVISHRLVRALIAAFIGAMLACAGALTQSVIRNPLASPDILGISHGASLAAVMTLSLFPNLAMHYLPFICFGGAMMASVILKLTIGKRFSSPMLIAVTGIALSAWFASINDYLLVSHSQTTSTVLLWLAGSLWGKNWLQFSWLFPWISILIVSLLLAQPLNLLLLGSQQAQLIGTRPQRIQVIALILAMLLTAVSVALCGPIGFVGLIAPHLARLLTGSRHQQLLPIAMSYGALILVLADLIGRTLLRPVEIPVGLVIALLGAPYFIFLLLRQKASLHA
ncbi:iron chelate uptake ABC transporter family permease subunit [Celerinatantimonas sp. YJH-8]|uniref:iron chelate uptake ABC transporter family permease subunit n=1 Tax=Celerinatantimonas sp. YJH-8 TaxID=3228714 RepID=UPI0038C750EF